MPLEKVGATKRFSTEKCYEINSTVLDEFEKVQDFGVTYRSQSGLVHHVNVP